MTENKKPLIILTGPTAVGKTSASIGLAKSLGCEIISADSMQVYKYMDIGSAKIMPDEMQGVPHYLVDELLPGDEFSVVRFQQMAKDFIFRHFCMILILKIHARILRTAHSLKIRQESLEMNGC